MSDTPLATVADAASFGYVLDPTSGPQFISRASARIRGYTGQTISRVIDDVVDLTVVRGTIWLPQRPADKPTSVVIGGNVFLENSTWHWDPVNTRLVDVTTRFSSANWAMWDRYNEYATITYSHGFTVIPDEVLEVVCAVAYRLANSTDGRETGRAQESVGGVSVTFATEATVSAASLLPGEKATLDRVLGRRKAWSVPLWP